MNTCIDTCPSGYFENLIEKKCQKCPQDCQDCSSNPNICNKCSQILFLHLNSCLSECPDGFYKDLTKNECISCTVIQNCQKCSSSIKCDLCDKNYEQQNNLCIQKQCPSNCQNCDLNTQTCYECSVSYYLYQNECKQSCPEGFYKNETNKKCEQQIEKNSFILSSSANKKNTITLTFKFEILNIEEIKDSLQISIRNYQKSFIYDINTIDPKTIEAQIIFQNGNSFTEEVNVNLNIKDSVSYENLQQKIIIEFVPPKSLDNTNIQTSNSIQTVNQVISTSAVAVFFPLSMSGNFRMVASILDISQLIFMTAFIDFKSSSNLEKFLESQKDLQIPFPNLFQQINHFNEIDYQTYPKMQDNEMDGFFLSNLGDTISMLATISFIKVTLVLLQNITKKFPKIQKIPCFFLSAFFPITLYFDLVWSFYQDMCFSVIVQFSSFNQPIFPIEIINYILFTISSFAMLLPILIFFIILKDTNKSITDYLTKGLNFKYYVLVVYFRKFFYTLVIGVLQASPNTQIILIILFHISYIVFVAKIKPFTKSLNNFKEITQGVLFTISHIIVIVMKNQEDNSDTQIISQSWCVITTFLLVILLEVFLSLYEALLSLKDLYLKYKNKKYLNKILPIATNKIEKQSNLIKKTTTIDEGNSPDLIRNKREQQTLNQTPNLSPVQLERFESRLQIMSFVELKEGQSQYISGSQSPSKRIPRRKFIYDQITIGKSIQNINSISQSRLDISNLRENSLKKDDSPKKETIPRRESYPKKDLSSIRDKQNSGNFDYVLQLRRVTSQIQQNIQIIEEQSQNDQISNVNFMNIMNLDQQENDVLSSKRIMLQ